MKFQGTFLKKEELCSGVFLCSFKIFSDFVYKPGQFLMFEMHDANGKFMRSYSIYSYQSSIGIVQFIIKLIDGRGSNLIKTLKPNDTITLHGPMGTLFLRNWSKQVVFIGAGTGISPLVAMTEELVKSPSKTNIYFLNGQRSEEDIFLSDTFETLAKTGLVKLKTTLSQPRTEWVGFKGRVTEHMADLPVEEVDYYICGSESFVTSVTDVLKKRGVDSAHIFTERFSK